MDIKFDSIISLRDTIGNDEWLKKNEKALKEIFPDTWTHIENLNGIQIGFQFKLLGIDWRSEEQFTRVMTYLERIKIILRDGFTIKANPHSIFT